MNITDAALKKLLQIKPSDKQFLLVSRHAGGCSGWVHKMGFVDNLDMDNYSFEEQDELSLAYPSGDSVWFATATLDFKDGLDGTGFTWDNSQKKSCCGCKKSFC